MDDGQILFLKLPCKCWGRKGQRQKISGQRGHGRVNVMGGIREQDRKRVCFLIQRGNADTFYEQIEQLHEFVKQEWISQVDTPLPEVRSPM